MRSHNSFSRVVDSMCRNMNNVKFRQYTFYHYVLSVTVYAVYEAKKYPLFSYYHCANRTALFAYIPDFVISRRGKSVLILFAFQP